MTVQDRHALIMARMATSAKRAGRNVNDISLIAVSKVQPDTRIEAMLKAGQTQFGENRVQEAQTRWGEKFAKARKNIELRLIGPLQSNKTEDAVALFDVIETVDREKLLKTLAKSKQDMTAQDAKETFPRLYVQVNTGEEPQKSGVMPSELPTFITLMRETYDLHPEGLMCIPPQNEAPSPHFWLLKKLACNVGIENLSMGMSGDFEAAIEMGATSIRVGSAIFGDRDYA